MTKIILFLLTTLATSLAFALSPGDLVSQYQVQLGQTTPVATSVQNWLKQHTVLFIDGLGSSNSDLSEYALTFKNDFNYPGADFLAYSPSWTSSADQNAETVYTQIMWLKKQGLQKPLILIGQSMGGAEVFLAVVRHPELISQGIVDHVVVMQGPVGGTPLGEVLNRMTELSSSSASGWFFTYWASRLMNDLGWLQGAKSLAPATMQPIVAADMAQLGPANAAMISNVTYFVTVCQNPNNPSYPLSTTEMSKLGQEVYSGISQIQPVLNYSSYAGYINSFGPSDDMVPLQFQSISGFGMTFSPLYGSHGNYLNSNWFTSTSTPAQVRAYVRALIITLSPQ